MPKQIAPLSATQVKALRKQPGFHNVGGVSGLLLEVTETGAASWVLRATVHGRVRHMGLGSASKISLEAARTAARAAHEVIAANQDPIELRAAAKRKAIAEAIRAITFREATRQYFTQVKAKEFRNDKARGEWLRSLELHTFEQIGRLPVHAIEQSHILAVLEPLWPRPVGVALRASIQSVLDWSRVRGYREGDNPASWDTLKYVLAKPGKAHNGGHHAALDWQDMPAFVADLRAEGTVAATAYEFLILTAGRSNEVRGATWEEIDLDAKLWTIPEGRMKAGKQHQVPLSPQVIRLLESLPGDREGLVFKTGKRKVRALFDHELGSLKLKRDVTVHGARSSFKEWARSLGTRYTDESSELALAHVSGDATRAAYARGALLPERSRMMAEWGQFVTSGKAPVASVTTLNTKRA